MVSAEKTRSIKRLIRTPRLICLFLSFLFYLIAIVTPSLYLERNRGEFQGLGNWSFGASLLVIGWLGILCGQYGWFANLPLVVGWLTLSLNRRLVAGLCGTISVVVALHTLELFRTPIPGVESRNDSEILKALGVGYYLWVLSMVLVVLGAILGKSSEPNKAVNPRGGSGES